MIYIYKSEIHIINKNHRLYDYCDKMCFKSKNLYNRANFIKKDFFKKSGKTPSAFDLNKMLKTEDCFKAMPSKTSQQTLIKLDRNWKSFFMSLKSYSKDKTSFCGKPKPQNIKTRMGDLYVNLTISK